jgi:peptide/nickel transport system ATP-binding protein
LAMGIVAALGNSVANIVYATAIINLPIYARLARAEANVRRSAGFVEAVRLCGNSEGRIVLGQLLPNILPLMMVQVSLTLGYAILNAAGLSFIGLGVRPPTAEWGIMVAEGASFIVSGEWWVAFFPDLVLMTAVLCFNLLGDGLRDIVDPPDMSNGRNTVPLLAVEDLAIEFLTRNGTVRALDGIGFELGRGETMALVGESGSGKSVTAYAIMGILDAAARITSGRIMFGGLELLQASERAIAEMRGRELEITFQNPRTALNPIRPVGKQIADVLLRHGNVTAAQAAGRAVEMLAKVRIPDPERRARSYPFELSGGMCQRVMIAMALACAPQLLIADEPTTGLDITTQAVIMDLIADLAASRNMATLLITHDLGLAAEYCDYIAVMHAGHIVETAPTAALFAEPHHPYTAKLIAATPGGAPSLDALAAIPGALPDLRRTDLPPCRYTERCERAAPDCVARPLPRRPLGDGRQVSCHFPL